MELFLGGGGEKQILQDKQLPMSVKKQVMDQCVLPTMTYGCQTLSLNKQLTAGRAAQGIQSEPSIQTHLRQALLVAIFKDTLCDGSTHTIEAFLPGAVERGKDCGRSRSLADMCTGLSKDSAAHIPPSFPGVAHCKVITCGLTYLYSWGIGQGAGQSLKNGWAHRYNKVRGEREREGGGGGVREGHIMRQRNTWIVTERETDTHTHNTYTHTQHKHPSTHTFTLTQLLTHTHTHTHARANIHTGIYTLR